MVKGKLAPSECWFVRTQQWWSKDKWTLTAPYYVCTLPQQVSFEKTQSDLESIEWLELVLVENVIGDILDRHQL